MGEVTLRRYRFRTNQESGWAIIVIGSDGYFSAVSDHGNYAYIWGAFGDRDFREFLIGLNAHYFFSKITWGRERGGWDPEGVARNMRRRLFELVDEGAMDRDLAHAAADEIGYPENVEDVYAWMARNDISDAKFNVCEGIYAEKPNGLAWGFVKHVLPRFQRRLRAELALEAKRARAA